MASPHSGSDFDDFLRDEDLCERATERAIMRVVAWQLKQEMAVSGISKVEMAARMNTSRSQLDRILNGEDENIGIETIGKAARAVGKNSSSSWSDLLALHGRRPYHYPGSPGGR